MQTTSIKLYSLGYNEAKTYLVAALFVLGNIALPQLCHLVPRGGMIWLPIYFFTLVGAYKYGWRAGLLTAVVSPVANHLLFGMPAAAMLTPILVKSTLLALAAGYAAAHFRKVSLALLEWLTTESLLAALQDFRLGIAGMLLQIVGGYAVIRYMLKK